MPFRSPQQERFMWAKHPDIARRWANTYGSFENPKRAAIRHVRKKRRKRK